MSLSLIRDIVLKYMVKIDLGRYLIWVFDCYIYVFGYIYVNIYKNVNLYDVKKN